MGWYDLPENNTGALCARLSGDAAKIQVLNFFNKLRSILKHRIRMKDTCTRCDPFVIFSLLELKETLLTVVSNQVSAPKRTAERKPEGGNGKIKW
jgi:hypothetical protein